MSLDGERGTPTAAGHSYTVTLSAEPWGRCEICGYAEAAHEHARGVYTPTATSKRCPACVQTDAEWCPHA